jgi:glutaredoxin
LIKIFHNSMIACQHCQYAVSFMERYKYEYKTIDISQSDNKEEYQKAEDTLHELKYDIGILPFVMINEENGFTGFPSPETEYEILEYLEQLN